MNYDGVDLTKYLHIIDIERPLLPPQEVIDKRIVGKDGSYFLSVRHQPINIPVTVTFQGDEETSYREKTRLLAGLLNKNEPKRLVFDDEPGVYIKAILSDSTEITNLVNSGETVLNFYCSEPFYYEIDDETFSYSNLGNEEEFDITRTRGNVTSFPWIEIEGTNSSGAITIETHNTKITFDGELSPGETLVLDSKLVTSFTEEVDGSKRSENNNLSTMIFPLLEVGVNNFKISSTDGAKIDELRIYANSNWV